MSLIKRKNKLVRVNFKLKVAKPLAHSCPIFSPPSSPLDSSPYSPSDVPLPLSSPELPSAVLPDSLSDLPIQRSPLSLQLGSSQHASSDIAFPLYSPPSPPIQLTHLPSPPPLPSSPPPLHPSQPNLPPLPYGSPPVSNGPPPIQRLNVMINPQSNLKENKLIKTNIYQDKLYGTNQKHVSYNDTQENSISDYISNEITPSTLIKDFKKNKKEEKFIEGSQQPSSAYNFFEKLGVQSASIQMQISSAISNPNIQMDINEPQELNMPNSFKNNPTENHVMSGTMPPIEMGHPSMMQDTRPPSFGPQYQNMTMMQNPQQMTMPYAAQNLQPVPPGIPGPNQIFNMPPPWRFTQNSGQYGQRTPFMMNNDNLREKNNELNLKNYGPNWNNQNMTMMQNPQQMTMMQNPQQMTMPYAAQNLQSVPPGIPGPNQIFNMPPPWRFTQNSGQYGQRTPFMMNNDNFREKNNELNLKNCGPNWNNQNMTMMQNPQQMTMMQNPQQMTMPYAAQNLQPVPPGIPGPNQIFNMPPPGRFTQNSGQYGQRTPFMMNNDNFREKNNELNFKNCGPNWNSNGSHPNWQFQNSYSSVIMGSGDPRPPIMQNAKGSIQDNWMNNNSLNGGTIEGSRNDGMKLHIWRRQGDNPEWKEQQKLREHKTIHKEKYWKNYKQESQGAAGQNEKENNYNDEDNLIQNVDKLHNKNEQFYGYKNIVSNKSPELSHRHIEEKPQNSKTIFSDNIEQQNYQQKCIPSPRDSEDNRHNLGNKEQYSIDNNNRMPQFHEANIKKEKENSQQNYDVCLDGTDEEHNLNYKDWYSIDHNICEPEVIEANIEKENLHELKYVSRNDFPDQVHHLDTKEQFLIDNYNRVPRVYEANESYYNTEMYKRIDINVLDGNDVVATIFRLESQWNYEDTISLAQLEEPTGRNELFKKYNQS